MGPELSKWSGYCEVNPHLLHRWRRELRDLGARAFSGNGKGRAEENRVAELERRVGRPAMEIVAALPAGSCRMWNSTGNCRP